MKYVILGSFAIITSVLYVLFSGQPKCAYFTHDHGRDFSSPGKHKTNRSSLNSLNRQALTGIDQCSDGGMWMSHVFSIIYTALLFLSPPLRQVSILLHRNQSVICQTLSIRRLIYVSYCGWLHASVTAGKEQMGGWGGGGRDVLQETPSFHAEINRSSS